MAAARLAMGRPEPDALRRALSVSFAVHIGLVLTLFMLPSDWFEREKPQPVSIALMPGSPGPRTGGMTPAGARPIQAVAPPEKRPSPILPAAPPKADAIVGQPIRKPATTPSPAPPSTVPARPPTTGAQVTPGTAAAATGSTGQGAGLSVGGGAGGASATLEANFCCPEYAEEVLRRIGVTWKRNQPEAGEAIVVFEIRRDGSFSKPQVERSSGSVLLDLASISAFEGLRLPPLPERYSGSTLKIHLTFPYKR